MGSAFRVHINCLTYQDDAEGTDVILKASRVPFAISNVDSETLTLDLEFRTRCDTAERRAAVLRDINVLMGRTTGTLEDEGVVYDYSLYFELAQPYGPPEVDMGTFKQDLGASGNMLLTAREGGAVVSNSITTFLWTNEPGKDGRTLRGFLPTISVTSSLDFGAESYRPLNDKLPRSEQFAYSSAIEVTALFLNRELDSFLSRRLQLVERFREEQSTKTRDIPFNDVWTLDRVFPGYSYSKQVILGGGTMIEQAGAYAQYRLSLLEVPDDGTAHQD